MIEALLIQLPLGVDICLYIVSSSNLAAMTSQLLLLLEILAPAPVCQCLCCQDLLLLHQSVFGVCEQCNSSNIIIYIIIIVPVIINSVNNINITGSIFCLVPNLLIEFYVLSFL